MQASPNQLLTFTPQSTNKQITHYQPAIKSPQGFSSSSAIKQFLSHDHDYLAYCMQIFACLVWTSSYVYTNQHSFNSFQIVMVKGVIGTILNYLVLIFRGFKVKFQEPRIFNGLLTINACILLNLLALPICQLYLPLPIVHTIGCSSIALVYFMDYLVHGTKITRNGLIGIVLALLGVLLMTNNKLIMSQIDSKYVFDSTFSNYRSTSLIISSIFALVLFTTRIFHSYGLVILKHYPQISVFQLNYHNNILCTLIGGMGYMFMTDNKPFHVFWPSIISIGIGQFICFTAFFYSLKLTKKTGNVMIINGINIVIAFVISYFRYGQKVNIILIIGTLSLFISMSIVIYETMKLKKKNNIQSNKMDEKQQK